MDLQSAAEAVDVVEAARSWSRALMVAAILDQVKAARGGPVRGSAVNLMSIIGDVIWYLVRLCCVSLYTLVREATREAERSLRLSRKTVLARVRMLFAF